MSGRTSQSCSDAAVVTTLTISVVVLHKLMIESNEYEYLQRANRFAPGTISLRYQ
jgi:hypothetical protein